MRGHLPTGENQTDRVQAQLDNAKKLTTLYREREHLYSIISEPSKDEITRMRKLADVNARIRRLERWFTRQRGGKQFIERLLLEAL